MSKEKPLLSRRICINDGYDITLGRLFFSMLIAGLQALMILAGNGWIFTPVVFSTLLVAITSIRSRRDNKTLDLSVIVEKLISIEDRLTELESRNV